MSKQPKWGAWVPGLLQCRPRHHNRIHGEGGLLTMSGNPLLDSIAYWLGDFGESPPFPGLLEK